MGVGAPPAHSNFTHRNPQTHVHVKTRARVFVGTECVNPFGVQVLPDLKGLTESSSREILLGLVDPVCFPHQSFQNKSLLTKSNIFLIVKLF